MTLYSDYLFYEFWVSKYYKNYESANSEFILSSIKTKISSLVLVYL